MTTASNRAQTIRTALDGVARLRVRCTCSPPLAAAVTAIKSLQKSRFEATYADLAQDPLYAPAVGFFLEELYSDRDFADRDTQFARIAGTLQRVFPAQVVTTALALAELHGLTESLDHAMADSWLAQRQDMPTPASDLTRYRIAWRSVGRRSDREAQLTMVMAIGQELARLTRLPGLRPLLKMMRGPASAAGMASLQRFLESGFDTFATISRKDAGAAHFLKTIHARESTLMAVLFDAQGNACDFELQRLMREQA